MTVILKEKNSKEMEGKNQSRMQRQEKLAELKTKAERLLKEIRSGK